MNKWIRWPGLIFFALTLGAIFAFWFLFADALFKRGIESAGSYAVGAKVEIEKADLTFKPLGAVLTGIRVANPDEPMTNAFEAERASFGMDAGKLLLGSVIIEEMALEGMRFGTQRKSSGALMVGGKKPSAESKADKEKVKKAGEKSAFNLKSVEIPDAKQILGKEELKTRKEYDDINSGIDADKKAWKGKMDGLADSAKFEEYKSRIASVKSGGIKSLDDAKRAATELSSVKDAASKDLGGLSDAKSGLEKAVSGYADRIQKLKRLPDEDLNRIMAKHAPTPGNLRQMSESVLGEDATGIAEKGLYWYQRLSPYFDRQSYEETAPARLKGRDIRFREKDPSPGFLIRKVSLSGSAEAGEFEGFIVDITPDMDITGRPMTFILNAAGMASMESFRVSGAVNRVTPGKQRDSIDINIAGYEMSGSSISGGAMPLRIESGALGIKAVAARDGQKIAVNSEASLYPVVIKAADGGDSEASAVMNETFSFIDRVGIRAELRGTMENYEIRVSSNLKDVLQTAFKKVIERKNAELRAKVKEEIAKKTADYQRQLEEKKKELESYKAELDRRIAEAKATLKSATETKIPKLPF